MKIDTSSNGWRGATIIVAPVPQSHVKGAIHSIRPTNTPTS